MSFCQACGGKNADDARFCNLCGARIVKGESGPPRPAAGPATPQADVPTRAMSSGSKAKPAADDVWAMQSGAMPANGGAPSTGSASLNNPTFGNQTLAGVGIPSRGRTYGMLAVVALAFFAIGGLLVWLVMHGGEEAPATVAEGGTDPTAPGTEVPVGVEVPDDEHFLEGTRVVSGGGRGGASGGSGAASGGSGAASGGSGAASGGSGAASGGSGAASGGSGAASGASGAGSGGSGAASGGSGAASGGSGAASGGSGAASGGSGAGSGGSGAGSGGSGAGGGGSASGDRDWEAMAETIGDEEANHELNLYVVNVRRFIRNNYARQAGACFSHASGAGGAMVTGRVVIGFTISGTGSTDDVRVVSNPTGIDTLGTCLANRVDSWALPAPPRREPVSLEMPFTQ